MGSVLFVRDKPLVKLSVEVNFRMVTIATCYFLLLFQPPNIKYGVIATSSLGEKVLSANHGDPSRPTSGSEQVSPKPNPAEGICPLGFCGPVPWTKGRGEGGM